MKKCVILLFAMLLFVPSIFAASKRVELVNGYDEASNSFCCSGNGRNLTEAVNSSLTGLRSIVMEELKSRCRNVYEYFEKGDTDEFIKHFGANFEYICREMMKYARNNGDYTTPNGYTEYYTLSAAVFESVMEKCVSKIGELSEDLKQRNHEIISVNRFYKGKYISGFKTIVVGVEE